MFDETIFIVSKNDDGMRIDRYCTKNSESPAVLIMKLLRKKKILLNQSVAKMGDKVRTGQTVKILYKFNHRKEVQSLGNVDKLYNILNKIKKEIIYEDNNIIAINKPAGISVQRGSKVRESLNDVFNVVNVVNKQPNRLMQNLSPLSYSDSEFQGLNDILNPKYVNSANTRNRSNQDSFSVTDTIQNLSSLSSGEFQGLNDILSSEYTNSGDVSSKSSQSRSNPDDFNIPYTDISNNSADNDIKIVHRLDKDVSGVLIFGKNNISTRAISDLFYRKMVIKKYIAVVIGNMEKKSGVIETPIFSESKSQMFSGFEGGRVNKMSVNNSGVNNGSFNNSINNVNKGIDKVNLAKNDLKTYLDAKTYYKTIFQGCGISIVELIPVTGRKHQIRIHMSSLGHPLIGDRRYGNLITKTNKEVTAGIRTTFYQDILNRNVDVIYLHSYKTVFKLFDYNVSIIANFPEYFKEVFKKYNCEDVVMKFVNCM